jgi:hypothetical protein
MWITKPIDFCEKLGSDNSDFARPLSARNGINLGHLALLNDDYLISLKTLSTLITHNECQCEFYSACAVASSGELLCRFQKAQAQVYIHSNQNDLCLYIVLALVDDSPT